jgi:hypothetical protein
MTPGEVRAPGGERDVPQDLDDWADRLSRLGIEHSGVKELT